MNKKIIEKIFEKLKAMECEITKEKGEFSLFMLLLRKDSPEKYDLTISAPWLETDKRKGLEYLVNKVQATLHKDELLSISRIVILEKGNPTLAAVLKAVNIQQGNVRVENTTFSDLQVGQAFISTSVDNIIKFGQ